MRLAKKIITLLFLSVFLYGCSGNSKDDKLGNLADIRKISRELSDKYRFYSLSLPKEQARQRTVEWALEQKKVKAAGISPDGDTIWVKMENGIPITFLTEGK